MGDIRHVPLTTSGYLLDDPGVSLNEPSPKR
jgi:hypothetical protein